MSLSLVKWCNTISSPKNRSEKEKAQLFVDLFSDFFVIFLDWFRVLVNLIYLAPFGLPLMRALWPL